MLIVCLLGWNRWNHYLNSKARFRMCVFLSIFGLESTDVSIFCLQFEIKSSIFWLKINRYGSVWHSFLKIAFGFLSPKATSGSIWVICHKSFLSLKELLVKARKYDSDKSSFEYILKLELKL